MALRLVHKVRQGIIFMDKTSRASSKAASIGLSPSDIVGMLRSVGTEFTHSRLGSDWSGVDAMIARQGEVDFVSPKLDCHFLGLGLSGASIMSQTFDALLNNGEKCFHPGALYFVPAGHEVVVKADASQLSALQLMIDCAVMDDVKAEMLKGDPQRVDLLGFTALPNARLQYCARAIQHELVKPSSGSALLVDAMAQTICIEVVRSFSMGARKAPSAKVALSPTQIKCATAFFEATLDQNVGLRSVAEAVGVSTFHFARAFKKATGISPHRYLIERRIARAKQLLETSSDGLADIAYACGFSSQAHMTTTFSKLVGLPPGGYRQMLGGNAAKPPTRD